MLVWMIVLHRNYGAADLLFELNGWYFHVECQSTTDGRMIIRIMEYAMSIAIEKVSENEDGSFTIKFSSSCVIYLRSTNKILYFLMRYEDDCREAGKLKEQEEADRRMSVFMKECEDLLGRLSSRCSEKEQQYMFQTLADLIIEIAMYLAPKNEKEKVRIMGGNVIKTRAQILREEGEEKKAKEMAMDMHADHIGIEIIAKYVRYPVEVVEKWLGLNTAQN